MTQANTEKLSVKTKIMYGAGDYGFAMADTVIGVLFLTFLLEMAGLSPGQAAFAIFIGRVWDWINDPLIGYLSDRVRTRWGRRRPFLLFGFIPFALTFMMLWWIPPFDSSVMKVAYYAIAYFIYEAMATFVYMPYFALTPELTRDYDERTSLTSYRMFFSILAGLVAFVVPLAIIGEVEPENASKLFWVMVAFGISGGLPLLITFFGTKERPELYREEAGLKESVKAALNNRPFIFAMGIFLFTWTAIQVVQSMLILFLKYKLDREGESDIILGTVFVVAMISLPLWVYLSDRWDKRKAYVIGMVFTTTVLMILAFTSAETGLPIVFTLAALAGIGIGCVHVLPWSIIPDAIEWDELQTGKRHEGMFYSLVVFFRKVATSIALPITALVLGATGFDASLDVQPAEAVSAISMMTGPLPGVFMFFGILFALSFPISREKHAEIREQIEKNRKAASEFSE